MHATLHLVFKILKWPVALIALVGLPGMAVACWNRLSASFTLSLSFFVPCPLK